MKPADRTARMRAMIAGAGMTQAEVARRLGVSLKTVECWLTDRPRHRNPPAPLLALAEIVLKGETK